MAPKVRLDLMVKESTKQFLQGFARERGVSMSEMVDQLIMEHLMHMPIEDIPMPDVSAAVFDMLKIQELQQRVAESISKGKVCSFDEYCKLVFNLEGVGEDDYDGIVYVPTDSPYYGIIVSSCLIDEAHDDIIATYGGDYHPSVLKSVDAYLEWVEESGDFHPCGLCIVPKGGDPTRPTNVNDWDAHAKWPVGVPEPWNE